MRKKLVSILNANGAGLHALLLRLTLRADAADDLLQELFLKLDTSPGFLSATDPVAYVFRAAINLAFDWRRRQQRDRHLVAALKAAGAERADPPWVPLVERDEVERILLIADELPLVSREAFVLRYVRGASYGEIATALARTPHQARGLCHAAVRTIRQRLGLIADASASGVAPSPVARE